MSYQAEEGLFTTDSAFRECRRIVQNSGSNFSLAFRLLRSPERRAMDALYAFMRLTDDISDGIGSPERKRNQLQNWRTMFTAALNGEYTHPIFPAVHRTIDDYGVDPRYLFEVIDGVEKDLEPVSISHFSELADYCHLVASAVGLACLPVWGCHDPQAVQPGRSAGLAFQLTNILRDLEEDRTRGRIYLPQEEILRFQSPPESWNNYGSMFQDLFQFQLARAKEYYREAAELNQFLSRSGQAIFSVMYETYRSLLAEIERNPEVIFSRRVRVPKLRKMMIFARAWPVKWGWISA